MEYDVPTICLDVLSQSHCLIAGSTGSGKSVFLNACIYTALRQGNKALMLIDPKRVELKEYTKTPVTIAYADNVQNAIDVLDTAIRLMESRYIQMQTKGLKLTDGDDIYLCIDELADLMISTSRLQVMHKLQKLLQLGRAAKIHILAATQCPSRRIIPAELTLNFTAKIGLHTDAAIESRQVIGVKGCEDLPMYGYGIYKKPSDKLKIYELPFYTDAELTKSIMDSRQANKHLL